MNHAKYLACSLMVLSLACAAPQEKDVSVEASAPAPTTPVEAPVATPAEVPADAPPSPMREYWSEVAIAAGLSPEQQVRFNEQLGAVAAKEAAWQQQYGQQYRQLEQQMTEARDAGDSKRIGELRLELAKLDDKKSDIYYEHDLAGELKQMLTEEQRAPYMAARLRLMALKELEAGGFTDEQRQQVRQMADEVAPRMLGAGDYEREQAMGEKLKQDVFASVLTPEQQAAVEGARVYDSLIRLYGGLGLSTAQIERIRQMSDDVGRQMVQTEAPQAKYAPLMAIPREVFEQVLNEDQQAEHEAIRLYQLALKSFRGVRFQPAQRDRVQQLCRQTARKFAEAEDDQAKGTLAGEMLEDIYRTVLDGEQQDVYETAVLQNMGLLAFRNLGLTAEQQEQIRQRSTATAEQISPEQDKTERDAHAKAFMEGIEQEVLTDRQRELLARAKARTHSTTQPATQPETLPTAPQEADAPAAGQ